MNTVVIIGRLAGNPDLKKTQSGTSVTSFSLAVQRSRKDPNGEYSTDWIDVVAWGKTAEFICNYFSKGQMMAVSGSIQTRSWEDKSGNRRKSVEVVAQDVSFCGSRKESTEKSLGYEPVQDVPDTFEELVASGDLPF